MSLPFYSSVSQPEFVAEASKSLRDSGVATWRRRDERCPHESDRGPWRGDRARAQAGSPPKTEAVRAQPRTTQRQVFEKAYTGRGEAQDPKMTSRVH
jgi:hypothetical protein